MTDRFLLYLYALLYVCTHSGWFYLLRVHQGQRICIYSMTELIFVANRGPAETCLTLFVIEINRHVSFINPYASFCVSALQAVTNQYLKFTFLKDVFVLHETHDSLLNRSLIRIVLKRHPLSRPIPNQ